MEYKIVEGKVRKGLDRYNRINIGESIDPMWGLRTYVVSMDDLRHLESGGCLYGEDGEYATVIALDEDGIKAIREIGNEGTR